MWDSQCVCVFVCVLWAVCSAASVVLGAPRTDSSPQYTCKSYTKGILSHIQLVQCHFHQIPLGHSHATVESSALCFATDSCCELLGMRDVTGKYYLMVALQSLWQGTIYWPPTEMAPQKSVLFTMARVQCCVFPLLCVIFLLRRVQVTEMLFPLSRNKRKEWLYRSQKSGTDVSNAVKEL